jgi:riboflavin kinase/FMN adenylyltransferase
MKIAHSLAELAALPAQASVVSIGNFDGVHCGHRKVIAALRERALQLNARSVAVTFDPHPAQLLHSGPRLPLITPLEAKLDLLAATGLDVALVLPFTDELRLWSARRFAEIVLRDSLHTLELHEGETFRLGHHAETDITGLAELGRDLGFSVHVCSPLIARGAAVSSSRIRRLIAEANLHTARALLGRSFAVRSTPAAGRGYGTRYTVPTINLAPYPALLPANGVYITRLEIGSGADSRIFRGVTNAGNRPTFGADSFAVETHLLDFEPIALDETTPLHLTFLHRLRAERRFDSPDALRVQIGLDVAKAQRYFALGDKLGATYN